MVFIVHDDVPRTENISRALKLLNLSALNIQFDHDLGIAARNAPVTYRVDRDTLDTIFTISGLSCLLSPIDYTGAGVRPLVGYDDQGIAVM